MMMGEDVSIGMVFVFMKSVADFPLRCSGNARKRSGCQFARRRHQESSSTLHGTVSRGTGHWGTRIHADVTV